MFGPRVYFPHQHEFFADITTLFVNLASFNAAVESFWTSSTKIPQDRDHTLNLYGKVAHVSFPIHDLMHLVVRNRWPAELKLTLHPSTLSAPSQSNSVTLQSDAIVNMVTQLVGAMFLKYYERNSHRAKKAFGTTPRTWPETWRLAWLLRNAIAHGDKWAIDDKTFPETVWHSSRITTADSGQPWYDPKTFLGGGDVILLMEEMNTLITPSR